MAYRELGQQVAYIKRTRGRRLTHTAPLTSKHSSHFRASMWRFILVLGLMSAQIDAYFLFTSPSLLDQVEELVESRREIADEMIPVLKDRHPTMPKDVLESRNVMKVIKFLKENSEVLRARSDAKTVTRAEAEVAMKLQNLNQKADKILKPLLEHYHISKSGEHRIDLDTIRKLKETIQDAAKKKDQKKIIKKLLKDL